MSRYLITSALPYINGMKHLGNLAGSLLPADVFARFLRSEGEEVLFICATDEHGTPAEIAAAEAALDVATYCDIQHRRQAEVYREFGLSFDFFGRTSRPQNHELTQRFFRRLEANGFIVERTIQQFYSVADQRFLPDRYVVGTCPKCGYEAARGDQCENCTSVLEPTDLKNPRSGISGSTALELRTTRHLFLRLDRLSERLRAWVESHPEWPRLTTSVALKWLDEGLEERCITRDLSWGVPVPKEGYEGKVFYVWFDAPIGYIAATKEWSDAAPGERDWTRWWLNAEDVQYFQFMAKDNLPFHTIFFPGMIMGTGEPWTLPSFIKGFSWLTYYGGKFSTSQKRGVFMDQALEVLPADYWRYFLMHQAPESDDADFTWEQFAAVINKDLVGIFGNFIHRTLKLTASQFGNQVPAGGEPGERERALARDCAAAVEAYRTALRKVEFRKAVQALRRLWMLGNQYLDERAPWNLVKRDRETGAMVLRTAINLIRLYALAAEPILPFTAQRLFEALKMTPAERKVPLRGAVDLSALAPGRPFESLPPLFRRLDAAEVERLKARFGGET